LGDFILLLAAQPEAQRASTRVVIGMGFFFAAAAVLGVNSQSPWPARQAQALVRLHELSRNMMGTVCRVCRNVKQWRNAARALRWTAADAEGRRFSVVLSPQALARAQSNADRSSRQVRDPKQLEENLNVA
jgi:hypothetical protein